MKSSFIERKIVIGAIISAEYLGKLQEIYKSRYIQSSAAKLLLSWCNTYFQKYNKAPGKNIQIIYDRKLSAGLDEKRAEYIELVLSSLSKESIAIDINVDYLFDETKKYFRQRSLEILSQEIQNEVDGQNIEAAEALVVSYNTVQEQEENTIDVFSKQSSQIIKEAFSEREKPLIRFPKALGRFWNQELIRGGFVALMGHEKIGKTWTLIELALRAVKNGSNVAFFQAGDMTEKQQIRRLCIYLNKRSDQERYCRGLWVPTVDCWLNQCDECNRDEREDNDEKIFQKRKEVTYEALISAALNYKNSYSPCHNCNNIQPMPWLVWNKPVQPLTWKQAYKTLYKFSKKYKHKFMLSTYANENLSVTEIRQVLDRWEKRKNFMADVVVIDYADILIPCPDLTKYQFRHQQNKIWQRLRRLSEERHCLVITATQAKATSYGKYLLDLGDYSEDKRKYAHVTAMYGLNQTPEEKRIGLMRINELLLRESDFDSQRPVTILQRLQMGRPFIGSYFQGKYDK